MEEGIRFYVQGSKFRELGAGSLVLGDHEIFAEIVTESLSRPVALLPTATAHCLLPTANCLVPTAHRPQAQPLRQESWLSRGNYQNPEENRLLSDGSDP